METKEYKLVALLLEKGFTSRYIKETGTNNKIVQRIQINKDKREDGGENPVLYKRYHTNLTRTWITLHNEFLTLDEVKKIYLET